MQIIPQRIYGRKAMSLKKNDKKACPAQIIFASQNSITWIVVNGKRSKV